MNLLGRLAKLSADDRRYIRSECSQAIDALKGGVRVKNMGFEEYVEYTCLKDYVALAEDGHRIDFRDDMEVVT